MKASTQDRRTPQVRPDHRRRPPRHGQERARDEHGLRCGAAFPSRRRRRHRASKVRGRASVACSASKCRPTSSRLASSRSSRGSVPRTCAWARSASRSSGSSRGAAAELQTLPLYIDDTPGLTIAALRTRARRLKRQKGIGVIVVDYLQLLQGTGRNEQRQPRTGNLRDQPRPQAARQGARRAGDRVCRSSAVRSSSARTNGRSFPTCASRARSSRTPTSCSSSTARTITSKVSKPRCRAGRASQSRENGEVQRLEGKVRRVAGKAEVIVAKQRHGSTGNGSRSSSTAASTKFSDAADDGYLPEMRT